MLSFVEFIIKEIIMKLKIEIQLMFNHGILINVICKREIEGLQLAMG